MILGAGPPFENMRDKPVPERARAKQQIVALGAEPGGQRANFPVRLVFSMASMETCPLSKQGTLPNFTPGYPDLARQAATAQFYGQDQFPAPDSTRLGTQSCTSLQ